MLFPRGPHQVASNGDAGDVYRIVFHEKLLFRIVRRNVSFQEWCDETHNALHGGKEFIPWLEKPFRENPFLHNHYNHGNVDEDAEYLLIVKREYRGSDGPETYVMGLFIPSGVPREYVKDHMNRTIGIEVDIMAEPPAEGKILSFPRTPDRIAA